MLLLFIAAAFALFIILVWQLARVSRQQKAKEVNQEAARQESEGDKKIINIRAKQDAEKVHSTDADNIANF